MGNSHNPVQNLLKRCLQAEASTLIMKHSTQLTDLYECTKRASKGILVRWTLSLFNLHDNVDGCCEIACWHVRLNINFTVSINCHCLVSSWISVLAALPIPATWNNEHSVYLTWTSKVQLVCHELWSLSILSRLCIRCEALQSFQSYKDRAISTRDKKDVMNKDCAPLREILTWPILWKDVLRLTALKSLPESAQICKTSSAFFDLRIRWFRSLDSFNLSGVSRPRSLGGKPANGSDARGSKSERSAVLLDSKLDSLADSDEFCFPSDESSQSNAPSSAPLLSNVKFSFGPETSLLSSLEFCEDGAVASDIARLMLFLKWIFDSSLSPSRGAAEIFSEAASMTEFGNLLSTDPVCPFTNPESCAGFCSPLASCWACQDLVAISLSASSVTYNEAE